jgi:hypothetical protein
VAPFPSGLRWPTARPRARWRAGSAWANAMVARMGEPTKRLPVSRLWLVALRADGKHSTAAASATSTSQAALS